MEPQEPLAAPTATTITAKIIVRHAAKCPSRAQGSDYRRCNCRKSLLVYEGGGSGTNRRISAKTRSWEKAEAFLKGYLDSFDPDKQELKRLKAEKERATVRIEEAVSLYIQDMIARLGDNGTVAGARALLGNVNPETMAIVKNGHLFAWLDKFNSTKPAEQRLTYVSEITQTHLTMWRATWNYGSDLTAWTRWLGVKAFFKFCDLHGWTNRDGDPAAKMKNLEKSNETRTTIFSDAQYEAILAAIPKFEPGNQVAQRRLLCFTELLRWAGMAIGDGLHYRPDMIKDGDTLQYARRKNGQIATIAMPAHVLKLLADIPLLKNNAPDMPFRDPKLSVEADIRQWDKAGNGTKPCANCLPWPVLKRYAFPIRARKDCRTPTCCEIPLRFGTSAMARSCARLARCLAMLIPRPPSIATCLGLRKWKKRTLLMPARRWKMATPKSETRKVHNPACRISQNRTISLDTDVFIGYCNFKFGQ